MVPALWSAFLVGLLIGGSHRIEEGLRGAYVGLSEVARVGIRQGVSDHLPGRLGFFDSWAAGESASSNFSDIASAGAVVRYFSHDGGARLILGSREASGLVVWSEQVVRRFMLLPALGISFMLLAGSCLMAVFQDRRRWRAIAYFSSRALVLCAYWVVAMKILGSFGDLWLMGSASSRLTDLPVTVPLWSSVLASGPLISASAFLVVVYCLSCGLEAYFPDP